MTYFDTDVLVHYFVGYAPVQHEQSKKVIEQAMTDGLFYVSQLLMQELAHTMGKFNQPAPLVEEAISILKAVSPINYDLPHFERAMQLAAMATIQQKPQSIAFLARPFRYKSYRTGRWSIAHPC